MDDLSAAFNAHVDQMADLIEKLRAEFQSGLTPAYDIFMGFFHAINWKEPFLVCLLGFHVALFLVMIISRRNINVQMSLFFIALAGVYLAERLNIFLANNWTSFATQNYFDRTGVFLSTLWSGPLLILSMVILINTLFSLCYLIVKWKKAELRHRARLAQNKED